MFYIDSHAHLTSEDVYSNITDILERAKKANINKIINICTDELSLKHGLILAQNYPWIHNTASTTPHDVEKEGELFFSIVEKHAGQGDLVAIGETGLDYYYEHSPKELQIQFLRRYLKLALEHHLPIVIHCRNAFKDFFEILDSDYYLGSGKYAPGVIHCFTGNEDEAEQALKRDWYISMSGIVTFKKSDLLKRVAKLVPLNRLLIETDTPYLAPQSQRGGLNEPSFLPEICETIADCKGISPAEVSQATSQNAIDLFGFDRNIQPV